MVLYCEHGPPACQNANIFYPDLANYFWNSSRVFTSSVNCQLETALCADQLPQGSGFPIWKYYTAENKPSGEYYTEESSAQALVSFMYRTGMIPNECDIATYDHCSEREILFINKVRLWDPIQCAKGLKKQLSINARTSNGGDMRQQEWGLAKQRIIEHFIEAKKDQVEDPKDIYGNLDRLYDERLSGGL
eukprot:CAMPEP_0197849962 /NCGR_PEP_ID=MMETSP1438-20131217/13792_1 /TAXON_ID=1461541 /ORGANISM="Pterosperma sp., Strain CCMP1384" /LENGTH=189 /DNA_ID=CAMNT_0043462883 /DNA_START=182 /DNA_END=751 /DNA_ORIENTATION=-